MTEPAVTGVGAELRRAREAQGLDVDDVAQQLKFAPRQIESLENERFDRLPGPTIARGMVRNYARLLKLDVEPLLERLGASIAPSADAAAVRFQRPVPFADTGRRSTLLYAGFSVAVLGLVALVAFEWHQERPAPLLVASSDPTQANPPVAAEPPSVPEAETLEATPGEETKSEVAAVQSTPAAAQPPARAQPTPPPAQPAPAPAKPSPAPQVAAVAPKIDTPAPAPAPSASIGDPQSASATPQQPAGEAANVHRVLVRCEEESWLEVRDGTGRTLFASLNAAGSERTVRGAAPLQLVIGNASHVTLLFDGNPVDLKPHMRGEVARLQLK